MSRKKLSILSAMAVFACFSTAYPIVGFGVHWGNDFTLSMKDKRGEQLSFEKLSINISSISGTAPSNLTSISGKNLPIFIDRSDWTRTNFNLGGKIYIDAIPKIDAIEVSANYGVWEYKGQVRYPTSLEFQSNVPTNPQSPEDIFNVVYDSLPVTLEEFDLKVPGIKYTPYMKLNLDLTIRKYLLQFPPKLHWFRLHAGGGASLHFATPVLSKSLIENALGDKLNSVKNVNALATDLFGTSNSASKEISKAIIKEIMGNMMTPHWGCHIDLGILLKLPVVPLGVYVDGKFMIPFGKMDESVDIGGLGLLVNSGVSLTF
ncbi:MAG TPA: hypothetical protein VHO70_11315 [Chitinispirillaceae bacterium]|nr:hypothetical protein [Chitinispirillaceae bacterium]